MINRPSASDFPESPDSWQRLIIGDFGRHHRPTRENTRCGVGAGNANIFKGGICVIFLIFIFYLFYFPFFPFLCMRLGKHELSHSTRDEANNRQIYMETKADEVQAGVGFGFDGGATFWPTTLLVKLPPASALYQNHRNRKIKTPTVFSRLAVRQQELEVSFSVGNTSESSTETTNIATLQRVLPLRRTASNFKTLTRFPFIST